MIVIIIGTDISHEKNIMQKVVLLHNKNHNDNKKPISLII